MRRWPSSVSLGTTLAAGVGLFVLGGLYLDRRLGTGVVFVTCGTVLAFVYGGYEVWKVLKALQREDREQTAARHRRGRGVGGVDQDGVDGV